MKRVPRLQHMKRVLPHPKNPHAASQEPTCLAQALCTSLAHSASAKLAGMRNVEVGMEEEGGHRVAREGGSVALLDLRGEVVADVAHVANLVLGDEGHVRRHAERDRGRERGRLGEEVEVSERK
eukprot:3142765-Rhodomonas_salina.1